MCFPLSLALGLGFGFIAAVLAFVIVFEAYQRQQFQMGRIWRESLKSAVFAFTVFLLSSIALGYLLRKVI